MKIGVLFPVSGEEKEILMRAAGGSQISFLDKRASGAELAPYEVLIGLPHPKSLADALSLRCLLLSTAGANRYLNCPEFEERGILLATASGAYGCGVSEWMLAMTMLLFKKLHLYRDNMHLPAERWRSHGKVKAIAGSTIVCIGTGDLGRSYAGRVKALGAHTIGVCRSNTDPGTFDEIYTSSRCGEVIGRADAVAMSLPSTRETQRFLSKELISNMRSDAYLINAGRGDTVDTEALIQALQSGSIAGAALDVTDPEPLPDASPLWTLPNVFISPHVAGGFNLDLTRANIISCVADNLARYVKGEPPLHLVDFKRGY